MQVCARKLILLAVAAALAVANGIPSRHALAGMHPHTMAVAATKLHHDTGQAAHHPHQSDQERGRAAAQAFCRHDGQGSHQPNSPLHNCCVASCSAVVFIFATFALETPKLNADYGVFPPTQLTSVVLTSADPPPR